MAVSPITDSLPRAYNLTNQRSEITEKFLRERGAQIKALKDEIDRLKQELAVSMTATFTKGKKTEVRESTERAGTSLEAKDYDKEPELHKRLRKKIMARTATLEPLEELFNQVKDTCEERAVRDLARLNEIARSSRCF